MTQFLPAFSDRFSMKKMSLLAVVASLAARLAAQDIDLAFADRAPQHGGGEIPVFYFEKGEVVKESRLETAPLVSLLSMPPCAPCPTISAIFINGCYNLAGVDPDEFIIINSGGGFTLSDLQIDFQSNGGGAVNNDIGFLFNNGFGTNVGSTPCGLMAGDISHVTGCANFISANGTTVVPPNTMVVLQCTANNGGPSVINYSGICAGHEKCVYVVRNSCDRSSGAFSNTASRTTGLAINGCSCQAYWTYPNPSNTDGDYYLTSGTSGTSAPCTTAPPVTGFPTVPVFNNPVSPLCATSPLTLPAITGTNLTGNQKYYTGPNGTGTAYAAGASFSFSTTTTLYIYDATVGCVAEKQLQIVPKPDADVSSDVTICAGGSTPLTASGGGTYAWSPPAGLSATNIANPIASPAATTTYVVTVTSATGGCTDTDDVTVTVGGGAAVTIAASPGTVIGCTNPTVTLTASGGATYQWSTGSASPSISVTSAGTFTVTATTASGCTGTATQVVTQNNTPPTAAITNNTGSTELNCNNASISLTATGGGTYAWSGGLGTNAAVTISAAGTYTVTVTAANGCTATASITITQNTGLPVVSITSNPNTTVLSCTVSTIALTAASTPPGATFSWTIPGGGNVPGSLVTASLSGTYTVTATSSGGCTAVSNMAITQNTTPPNATVSPTTGQLTCNTSSITLTAASSTPGATFNWGGGNTSTTQNATTAGAFTVTVTNPATGCTATATSTISQNNTPPGATVNPATAVLTCGNPTATLTATSAAGATFNWGNGNLTSTQIASAAGTFTVTATGTNGCTSTASATVTQNAGLPTVTISPASPALTCTTTSLTLTASSSATGATFLWNGGTAGPTLTVSTAGSYSVTVTAGNGCTGTASILVDQDIDQPTASVSPATATISCTNATAVLTASSTTTGATFNWGGGNTTPTKTVSAAGTYTVTITAPNGCTNTASASVSANQAQPDAAVSPANGEITCSNSTVLLTASSATTGATYNWGGGNTSDTKTVSTAGTHTVTVTDPANGCTATASSTVTQNTSLPNGSISPASPQLTCTNPSLTLTASSTTTGAVFLWPDGSTSAIFFVNAPGTYSVTVTGPNGCTKVVSSTVTQAPEISGVATVATQTTCGSATGTITLTPSGGGPFSYEWGSQPGVGTNPRSLLPAGTFTCTVTNSFGCTFEATTTVTAPNAPTVTTTDFPDTCGQTKGQSHLTITGGSTPYTIDWGTAPGSGSSPRLMMTAGAWTVTVTDANGCTVLATASIGELPPPTVQATTSPDYCNAGNGQVFLTITGDHPPFVIDWGGQAGSGSNPRTGLPAGNYSVTVTDAVSCSQMITMSVGAVTALPTAAIAPATAMLSCQDPSATLVATTNAATPNYLWSNSSNQNTVVATSPGTFTVTITAANGCSNTASAVVGGSTAQPDLAVSPAAPVLNCTSPTATLTASSNAPGATFSWGNGNNTPVLTVNSAGSYTVTVTGSNLCTATQTVVVTQNFTQPDLDVTPLNGQINCGNPSVTLTAVSPTAVSFLWNNTTSNQTLTTTVAGTFTVTVTAANGCTNTGGATVTADNTPPGLTLTPTSGEISCAQPTLNLTAFSATPGAAFSWTGGANTPVLTVNAAGTFTVTVTGPNLCTATASAVIVANNTPPPLTLTASSPSLTCSNPTATLTANSSPGATFLWQNGTSLPTFTTAAPGAFSVTATAATGGCTAVSSISINQILGISSVDAVASTPGCGGSGGSITLTVNGGTAPLSYDWGGQPGSGSNPRTGLPTGDYTATVTDANGCTATASASVLAPIPPTVGAVTTASGCGNPTGSATLTISGGTSPFSINWGSAAGSGSNPRTAMPAGPYSATVTDAAGCTVVSNMTVGQSPNPNVTATATAASCGQNNGQISLNITSGTGPYAINWGSQLGAGSNPRLALPAGSYTATVSDANGCSATASATVDSPGGPSLLFSNLTTAKCGLPNGEASLGIGGGTTPYSINWGAAPGTGTNPRTGIASGNWPVTVTDAAGCTTDFNVLIGDTPALADVATDPQDASCGQQNGRITVAPTGGAAPYSYNWGGQPGNGPNPRYGLPAGSYVVTVTDANGCTMASQPTEIKADPFVTGATFSLTAATCGLADGQALVQPISGVDVFQFQWGSQPGTGQNPRTKLPVGNYQVTVVDGNGCEATAFFTILPTGEPAINSTITNAGCGASDGQVSMTVAGGKPPFLFDWGGQPGSGTNPRTALPPGTFVATVTDANGCTVIKAAEIEQDSLLLTASATATTCGKSNGEIAIQPTGGGAGPLVYNWGAAPGLGSNPRTGLPAGTFSVTVSANANCSATASATVNPSPAGPTATATGTPTTCGGNTGQISVVPTGGTLPLNFDWGSQPGFGGNPRTSLPAGTFSVTITDAAGCSTEASATVNAPGAPTVTATETAATCGNSNGSASLTIGGGTTPYAIDWGAAPGLGSNPRTGLPAGNYLVTVTGGNGCSTSISVQISGNPALAATATATATTCGLANGQVSIQSQNGSGGLTFNWGTAPGTGQNPRTGLPAGTYSTTITDAAGCTATASATVDASAAVAVQISTQPAGCGSANGSVSFTATSGTGPFTANWGAAPGTGQNPRTGLLAGSYFLTVTDAAGCTIVESATVGSTNAPTVQVLSVKPDDCGQSNGSATVAATGGTGAVTFSWGTQPGTGGATRTGLPAGTYFVTATDAAGCSSSATVGIPAGAAAAKTFLTKKSCDPSAVGVDTVLLQTVKLCDSLVITTTTLAPSFLQKFSKKSCDPSAVGVDTVFLKTLFGCDSLLVTTTTFDAAAIDTTQLSVKTCDPSAVGSVQKLLKNAAGCDSLVITTTTLAPSFTQNFTKKSCNPAAVGVDTVFLKTVFGCDSLLVTTTTFDASAADTTKLSKKSCDPLAVGISQKLLKNAAGCDSLVITTTTLAPSFTQNFTKKSCNPSAVGVDTVFLKTALGCDSLLVTTTIFDQNAVDTTLLSAKSCDPLAVGTSQKLLKNAAGCDSLVITTTTLSPSKTQFLTAKSCNPAAVGVDTVFLKTTLGCDSLVVTTTTFDQNAVDTTLISALTCDPAAVGVSQKLLKNAAGCDSLVITTTTLDLTGCAPSFLATASPVGCNGGSDGKLTLTATAGGLPMTYSWKETATGATGSGPIPALGQAVVLTGLPPGNYSLTVTTAGGATAVQASLVVDEPAAISLKINVLSDFGGFAVRCAGGLDGKAEAVFQNGKPPVNFAWSGGGAGQIANDLPAGPLSVTLTDANGCTASASGFLGEPQPLASQFSVVDVRCAGEANGAVSLGPVGGGVVPYLFNFDGRGFGFQSKFTGLKAGDYPVEIEDANGCRDSLVATVGPGGDPAFALPIDSATIWSGDTLRLVLGGPVASISWQPPVQVWQNGPSEVVFAPLTSLLYIATLTDSAGCSGKDAIYVHVKNGRDFYAPNAIRPGAGLSPNDFFTLYTGGGVAEIEELLVFDRWGELVFSNKKFPPNDPSFGWDGRWQGDEAQPAVFVWRARLRLTDGRFVEKKGGLTVVR